MSWFISDFWFSQKNFDGIIYATCDFFFVFGSTEINFAKNQFIAKKNSWK